MAQTIFVQFSDSTEATIVSYFAGEQANSMFENLGTVLSTDSRWAAFYDSVPSAKGLPEPGS